MYKSAEVVKLVTDELGGKITRQPGPVPGINTKITSFLDPDGWKTVSFSLLLGSYVSCCSDFMLQLPPSTKIHKSRIGSSTKMEPSGSLNKNHHPNLY